MIIVEERVTEGSRMNDRILEKIKTGTRSVAGVTIGVSLLLLCIATYFSGPYLLVNTLVTAGMLALMATGLSLIFGVANLPLFAYGELFMVGTLTSFYVYTPIAGYLAENPSAVLSFLAPFFSILVSGLTGAIIGAGFDKVIFQPLRRSSKDNWVMDSFLVTMGISVIMINTHQLIFGSEIKAIDNYFTGAPLEIMGAFVSLDRLFACLLAVGIIFAFGLFMKYSRTGKAIRAVSQDGAGALLVGINLNRILTLTIALSCGLASVSGASLVSLYPSYPTVGLEPLYLAWFVVILVGLGNVSAALVGGLIVAIFKSLTAEYIGSGWDFIIPSFFIILVLIAKPNGIFGSVVKGVHDK